MSKLRMDGNKVNVGVMLGCFISPEEYARINENQKVNVGEQYVMGIITPPHYEALPRLPYKGKFGVVSGIKYRLFQNEPNPKAPNLNDPEPYMANFEQMPQEEYFLGMRMDMDLFIKPDERLREFAKKTALIYLSEPQVRGKLHAHGLDLSERRLRISLFMSPSVVLAHELYTAGTRHSARAKNAKILNKPGLLNLEERIE